MISYRDSQVHSTSVAYGSHSGRTYFPEHAARKQKEEKQRARQHAADHLGRRVSHAIRQQAVRRRRLPRAAAKPAAAASSTLNVTPACTAHQRRRVRRRRVDPVVVAPVECAATRLLEGKVVECLCVKAELETSYCCICTHHHTAGTA